MGLLEPDVVADAAGIEGLLETGTVCVCPPPEPVPEPPVFILLTEIAVEIISTLRGARAAPPANIKLFSFADAEPPAVFWVLVGEESTGSETEGAGDVRRLELLVLSNRPAEDAEE